MRKKEIAVFSIILIGALVSWLIMQGQRSSRDYGSIRITVGGEFYGEYSLNNDQKIDINGTNTCRIKDHEAKMIEAACPDHLCISQSAVDERGGLIICLPNQVVIEAIPSAEAQSEGLVLDAVAG